MAAVPLPLTYQELNAWMAYTGASPVFLERMALEMFDTLYLMAMQQGE